MDDRIVIAHIARPWGNKGEVTADMHTDFPERFGRLKDVTLRRGITERRETLERHWFHKGRVNLKFVGFDSISDAETIAGFDVVIPETELMELPEGEDLYYDFQLAGCDVVTEDGEKVGTVTGVLRTGAGVLLEMRQPNGREALVPFVDEICTTVDVDAKRIVAKLPEGLLDL